MRKIFLFFSCLNLIFFCFCKLEEEKVYDLILNTNEIKTEEVGENGIIAFRTNSSSTVDIFKESDFEKINFPSNIVIENGVKAKVNCSLWKPKKDNIYIFCKLEEELEFGMNYIKLEEHILKYEEKTIKFFSEKYNHLMSFKLVVPFLYADEQIIDFNDGQNIYELKFKIRIFNEKDIFGLYSYKYESMNFITLNNDCRVKENELICKINKSTFERNLLGKDDVFNSAYIVKKIGVGFYRCIQNITIKYNINKENIYIQIKRMLSGIASNLDHIAYETNVTEISPSVSQYFKLKFSKSDSQTEEIRCLFKKYNDKKPLFLLCWMRDIDSGNYTLNEIKQEMKLENINLKYNYIINPVKNNEIINYNNELKFGGFILSIRPDILDYTKKDSYQVNFYGGIKEMKGLALEPNLKDLNCDYEGDINCTIPKSYFEGQKDGYYYIYHENHLGGKSPCYEIAPFKVIFTPERKSSAEKINIFGTTFALLMVFILF